MRAGFISVVLFLSGASALIFQTLWLRLSGLAFGNSIWAAALILSSFMAGLGLGGALAAVLTLPRARPLRVYAALEVIIAIFGSTLVFGIPYLGEWMRPLFQVLWAHQQFLNVLRFSVSLCPSAHSHDCDGINASDLTGRSSVSRSRLRPKRRNSLWFQHPGCGSRGVGR